MLKIIRNTLYQSVGKAIMVLIGLVTTSILTRNLGDFNYGLFVLISSTFLLIDALADLGTRIIGVREMARSEGKKQKEIFFNLVCLRLILLLVAMVVGMGIVWWYPAFSDFKNEATVALLMSIFTFVAGNFEMLFQAKERMGKKSVVDVLFPLFFLVMLLVWNKDITVFLVFGGYLIARVLSLVWAYTNLKDKSWFGVKKIDKKLIIALFKKSVPMGLYLLIFTVYDKAIDSLVIERYFGVIEVGWYGLAYRVYGNLVMPAYFLVSSALPQMSRNKGKSNKNIMSIALVFVMIISPIVFLLAPLIMKILAGVEFSYMISAQLLRILCVALIFSFINHVKGFNLISRNGERKMFVLGIVGLVFNLLANLYFVPKYSVYGAAWVTVGTEVLMSVLYLIDEKTSSC